MFDSPNPIVLSRAKNPPASNAAAPGFFARLSIKHSWILLLPARVASAFIWAYQKSLSPALAALNPTCGCRFAPTCSHYAREALAEHGFVFGFFLTIRRLVKCGPWHPGGEDFVPIRRRPVCTKVTSV